MKAELNIPILKSQFLPGGDCISLNDNWLFHYTTADSFFKIIKSLKLKTSRLGKLNDLNEIDYNAYVQVRNPLEMVRYKEYIERECSIACFSQHTLYQYKDICYKLIPGCCNPSMWAHYAGNVSGVCLCFDKAKLIEENQKLFGDNIELQEVHYETNYQPYQPQDTANEFLNQNKNNIFFLKDKSWENESEVRLLLTNIKQMEEEPMISIAHSLNAIVFSQKFWHNNKETFIEETIKPNSFLHKMCPIYWLFLTPNVVAYDASPGLPLLFEMELAKILKSDSPRAELVRDYVQSLQKKYHMFEGITNINIS